MTQTKTITKEVVFPNNREEVWQAIANSDTLAEWIYPNNFEARVGHEFTFKVPGLDVNCKVLECDPPKRLAYSWEGGPVLNTKVTYRLESEGKGTRMYFEHSGFDTTIPNAETYIGGAEYGWNMMLGKLAKVLEAAEVAS